MEVVSVPTSLRLSIGSLFMWIPWVAFEVIIASRAPWWHLPFRNILYWSLAATGTSFFLFLAISSAKRWAFPLASIVALAWLIASVWMALSQNYPALGYFAVFQLVFLLLQLLFLRRELGRSFIDPQVRWFQGLPQPIPGLTCRISNGEKSLDLKVSRFDHDGFFVFAGAAERGPENRRDQRLKDLTKLKVLDAEFRFGDRIFKSSGVPTVIAWNGLGAGFRFSRSTSETEKRMGDFLETLRGAGYVS